MDEQLTLAFALILVGFLLLIAELFIPSFGILTALAVAALGIGVYMTFLYDQKYDTSVGWKTLLGVFVALPLLGYAVAKIWPRTPIGKKFFLQAPHEEPGSSLMASHQELEDLLGKVGIVISTLRPAGMVDFDGRRVDSIGEGEMVQEGQYVRCISVKAGKVYVRRVDKPDMGTLETADFS